MCSYNGESCDVEEEFRLRLDPFYGNWFIRTGSLPLLLCSSLLSFTFNWDGERAAGRAGAIYGLRVLLRAPLDGYLFPASDAAGFRLAIHHPLREPFPEVFGQSAPNGFQSSFGVRLERLTHLGSPYGDCEEGGGRETSLFPGEPYSVEGCYRSCFQARVLRMCHCGDPRFPVPAPFRPCASDDLFQSPAPSLLAFPLPASPHSSDALSRAVPPTGVRGAGELQQGCRLHLPQTLPVPTSTSPSICPP